MNHRSAVLSKRVAMKRVVVVILWTLLLLEVGGLGEGGGGSDKCGGNCHEYCLCELSIVIGVRGEG